MCPFGKFPVAVVVIWGEVDDYWAEAVSRRSKELYCTSATLEFGDPPAPLAIPFQNAIAEIGMLGCMALDGDGLSPCPGDLNNDGVVDGVDLGILITVWGGCP